MIATHQIQKINFINDIMKMNINGIDYNFNLKQVSLKLLNASEIERNFFKISPSGYGVHWPLIDEDLAIDALISG